MKLVYTGRNMNTFLATTLITETYDEKIAKIINLLNVNANTTRNANVLISSREMPSGSGNTHKLRDETCASNKCMRVTVTLNTYLQGANTVISKFFFRNDTKIVEEAKRMK